MELFDVKQDIICDICSENHHLDQCKLITITNHVHDNEIPTKAKLTLPDFLQLTIMVDGSYSISSKTTIRKGTRFGPIQAKKSTTLNPTITFPLKLFDKNEIIYLDTNDETECNWLMFIKNAEYSDEQNLICYQTNGQIWFVTINEIKPDIPFRVWYGPNYAKKMDKELLKPKPIELDSDKIDLNLLIRKQQKIVERNSWACKFCSRIEKDVITFANHIRAHYMAQLKKVCEICKHTFYSRKSLKKHLKIVHQPIDHDERNKSKKQTNKETNVGGPLLNNLFSDSLDNSNLILPQTDLNHFDLTNLMIDTDHLNVENLLNETEKDLDYFNFDIDNNPKKQYVCDICLKQFSKLRLLIIHLKQHTADYFCQKCLKIFCRKENYESHTCNWKLTIKCNLCEKKFPQKKYLIRHKQSVHDRKFKCQNCEKYFYSKKELNDHNCSKIPNEQKAKFICHICNKIFYRATYLKKHLKIHTTDNRKKLNESTICEICGLHLKNKNSYYLHRKIHIKPLHNCPKCPKAFTRKDTLENHLDSHQNIHAKFQCKICQKIMKTSKNLHSHINSMHTKRNSYNCMICHAKFHYRMNLNVHMKKKHQPNTINHHYQYYQCPICDKTMKLKSSLFRHLRKIHPKEQYDPNSIQTNHLKNHTENMDFNKNFDTEICLSIPDLTMDQEITLGKDAYILDNGTIVQPQENSDNVVIYVLDQNVF